MILDHNGKPVEEREKPPHRFGEFRIPEGARLVMREGISAQEPYDQVPFMCGVVRRKDFEKR